MPENSESPVPQIPPEKLFTIRIKSIETKGRFGGFEKAEDARKYTEKYVLENESAFREVLSVTNGPFWNRQNWEKLMEKEIAGAIKELENNSEFIERLKEEIIRVTKEKESRNELV